MKYLLPILVIILFSCNSKSGKTIHYGSLEGNVYWKYNEFVGNRGDAGSGVDLYGHTDTSLHYFTKADVGGDYRFDSIPEGYYLLIVRSRNTTNDPHGHLMSLQYYLKDLERICDTVVTQNIDSALQRSNYYYKRYQDALLYIENPSKSLRESGKYKDSMNSVAKRFLEDLPFDIQIASGIYHSLANKVELKRVSVVRNKTERVITDFGITYL